MMSDMDKVTVRYLRPASGMTKGQTRVVDRYIADSLCAEPVPNAEMVEAKTEPLLVTTNNMPAESMVTSSVKPRRPRRRR